MINPGDRKNDVRQIIPTLRAGDVITESFLASITQALNDRRPISNPPTQIYRQPTSAADIQKFKSWTYIDLAHPTVNQGVNGTVQCYSDTNNNFDGTTNAQKALFNFETPVTIQAGKKASVLFGNITSGSFPVIGASQSAAQWSATAFSGVPNVSLNLRLRPITASFVSASQTWNNFGSLTLGSATTIVLAGLTNAGVSNQFTINQTYDFFPPLSSYFGLDVSGALTCYGFVLDCDLTFQNCTPSTVRAAVALYAASTIVPRLVFS